MPHTYPTAGGRRVILRANPQSSDGPGRRFSRRGFLAAAAVPLVAGLAVRGSSAVRGSAVARAATPRVFFGLDVPDNEADLVDQLAAMVGEQPSVVSLFLKLDSQVPSARLEQMASAGQTAFVTLEPWSLANSRGQVDQPQYSLASIIDGDHDTDLRAIATQLGALRRPFYLRFAHEMNAWWYPWCEAVNGNRSGQYVDAWHHVHDVVSSAAGVPIRWVWSPNRLLTSSHYNLPTLAELFPGRDVVDVMGMTGYSHDDPSPVVTFDSTVDELERLSSLPLVLSEIGAEGGSQASWLRQLPFLLRADPRIEGFVYFETSPATTGATGDYQIATSPSSVSAFKAMLRSVRAI
jgi:hypothetical protein